jgi:hypothetical protein
MSDYLNSLVTRTLRLAPVVQPRPASLFEPLASGPVSETAFEVAATPAAPEAVRSPLSVTAELSAQSQQTEPRVRSDLRESVIQPATVPTPMLPVQVVPPSPFSVTPTDVRHEVSAPESAPSFADTGSTSTRNTRPTPSLIKPEVRIVSATNDREPTPPISEARSVSPVLPYAARPDSSSRTRSLNAQAAGQVETPETVVVTIGRVDVRAIFAPPKPAPRAARTEPQALSLDEYLKQRSEGRR